jgi:hypothetical protein
MRMAVKLRYVEPCHNCYTRPLPADAQFFVKKVYAPHRPYSLNDKLCLNNHTKILYHEHLNTATSQ